MSGMDQLGKRLDDMVAGAETELDRARRVFIGRRVSADENGYMDLDGICADLDTIGVHLANWHIRMAFREQFVRVERWRADASADHCDAGNADSRLLDPFEEMYKKLMGRLDDAEDYASIPVLADVLGAAMLSDSRGWMSAFVADYRAELAGDGTDG